MFRIIIFFALSFREILLTFHEYCDISYYQDIKLIPFLGTFQEKFVYCDYTRYCKNSEGFGGNSFPGNKSWNNGFRGCTKQNLRCY